MFVIIRFILLLIWDFNEMVALWKHGLAALLEFYIILFDGFEVVQLVEIVLMRLGLSSLLSLMTEELVLWELVFDRGSYFAG